MTPRSVKALKRNVEKAKAKGKAVATVKEDAIDGICKVVKFRSRLPMVIDLTEEDRMPATLVEKAFRCKRDEKDVYMFYYLQ